MNNVTDILSALKCGRFYLYTYFYPHFSRSEQVLQNLQILSLKVVIILDVASSGVSVLPLHTSLSVCNRPMLFLKKC